MRPLDLPHHEVFRCLACSGPAELLPSFLLFKDVTLHSLKDHMVALESAVQDSTLLPTTLTLFRCKLCPAENDTIFLAEEDLKTHLGKYHSDFFAKRWKKFSDLQCRICCEIVSDQDLFEDHMSRAHPRSLFADSNDVNNIQDLEDPNLFVADSAKEFKNVSDFKDIVVCKVEDERHKDIPIDVKTEAINSFTNPKQRPEMYLKPTDHLLDQSKIQPGDNDGVKKLVTARPCRRMSSLGKLENVNGGTLWEKNMRGSATTRILRTSELQPNQLFLMGIKKTVSAEHIKNYFFENRVQVAEVFTRNGFGYVTFVRVKDAEAWTGKVLEIDDCCIRTNHYEVESHVVEENELLFNKVPKVISLDDLYKFFLNQAVDIKHIYLKQNGTGRVVFRNRKDAEFWKYNPDDLVVKGIKINVLWKAHQWKRRSDVNDQTRNREREEREERRCLREESKRSRGVNESRSRSVHGDRGRQRSRERSRSYERSRFRGFRKRDDSPSWSERMRLCRS